MIDTTALTALISAFRAEVAQNSISPEKVGGKNRKLLIILKNALTLRLWLNFRESWQTWFAFRAGWFALGLHFLSFSVFFSLLLSFSVCSIVKQKTI